MTHNEWDVITKEVIESNRSVAIRKAVKLIFERLDAEGLIQIVPDTIISQSGAESILETIESDLDLIEDLYSTSDNEKDPVMRMGPYHFCVPSLWTLYAAIELSRDLNASFSLEEDEFAYLTALIPRKFSNEIKSGRNIAMDEVLNLYLPSVQLGNQYLGGSDQCEDCAHLDKCGMGYLSVIEKQVDNIINLRQYDEIRMTCEIMDQICDKSVESGHVLTGEELWNDLQEEANRTEKRIRKVLPKVKSWRRISTLVSIGLGAASFLNPIIGATAAIPALAHEVLSSAEVMMKKETSWVNFVNNPDAVIGQMMQR